MTPDNRPFDEVYHSLIEERRLLEQQSTACRKNFRLAKTHAYRMAVSIISLQAKDYNRFRGLAEREVGPGRDLMDRYIERSFAELEAIGEDFKALITHVHAGMTLDEYLADAPKTFLSKKPRVAADRAGERSPLPPTPDEEMSEKMQIELWRERALAAEQRIRTLEEELRAIKRAAARDRIRARKRLKAAQLAD